MAYDSDEMQDARDRDLQRAYDRQDALSTARKTSQVMAKYQSARNARGGPVTEVAWTRLVLCALFMVLLVAGLLALALRR